MKKLFILFLFLLSPAAFASGFSVGNAADGLMTSEGKVFLSDLYLAGAAINKDPIFGDKLSRDLFGFPLLEEQDVFDLVSRKLNDLDSAIPGLGVLLADVIRSYQWRLVDNELKFTCDAKIPYIDFKKSGFTHVQLANRHLGQILISRIYWSKMETSHKAALIMHEAIAGIAGRSSKSACDSSMDLTKFVMSSIFSKYISSYSFSLIKALSLSDDEVKSLATISKARQNHVRQNIDTIAVHFVDQPTSENLTATNGCYSSSEALFKFDTWILCRSLAKLVTPPALEQKFEITVETRPYHLIVTEEGVEVLFERTTNMSRVENWHGIDNCQATLMEVGAYQFFNLIRFKEIRF